jgi:hypothetical protein
MNLHGKGLASVKIFEKQRKSGRRLASTEQLSAAMGRQLAQRTPLAWSGGDDALIVAMIDHFPTLGVYAGARELFPKLRLQPATSPKILPVNRFEPKRRKTRQENTACVTAPP